MHGANSMTPKRFASQQARFASSRKAGLEFCNRLFAIERDLEEATRKNAARPAWSEADRC